MVENPVTQETNPIVKRANLGLFRMQVKLQRFQKVGYLAFPLQQGFLGTVHDYEVINITYVELGFQFVLHEAVKLV